ncbi:helix-turn-helix transcriptional regulator [Limnofasciculus baicalensis]|uniref:Helix-turn-helix domain-containing protein n=1 Tax=Limnofasciculus baicalensis BBK-W-15 TaxID=2699891 RepID=A0AAE3GMA8_9CYAN|nr:helix-turn-helix transcriptional regulator [Limnofasciculus baicalensis]MCP2726994.1 helix-turn-helix domain-containing protein [Limnofasciculus baicalensis BBK-W-15]
MASLGEKLKQRRESLHVTQRQIALELGVTVTTVQNWEAGRYIPKLSPMGMKDMEFLLKYLSIANRQYRSQCMVSMAR